MALTICPWKHGKQWVYSITYDEGLEELHRFAIPMHEELGMPGHVEVVAGHIGKVRQIGASSYNGFHHMGPEMLRDLLARGWGVGNHTWSHEVVTPENVEREIGEAKTTIEAAIGQPIVLYCSSGSNVNMADHALEACRRHGYLGAMSITDALNLPEDELFWLNRTPLHDEMYEPFYNAFDPYRNIRYAQERSGWIIDYCHCPLEEPVHRHKDCSAAQLRQRFEAVLGEGGARVWCANPDEVIAYHTTRRHTRVEAVRESDTDRIYRLAFDDLPANVPYRTLTLEADVPAAWCQDPAAWVGGQRVAAELVRPLRLRVTVEASHGLEIDLTPRRPCRSGKGE